jgi:hypothetical protein
MTIEGIDQGRIFGIPDLKNDIGSRDRERDPGKPMQPLEPIIESGLPAMLQEHLEGILTKAETPLGRPLAQCLVEVGGQIANLKMNGHEIQVTRDGGYMQSA